jgi:hypothetical protein
MNEDKADPVKQLTAIPWYDAGTLRALVVTAVGLIGVIASLFGIDEAVFTAKAPKIIDALMALIALGSLVWAVYARTRQPTPPVTLTQASADQHNANNQPTEIT